MAPVDGDMTQSASTTRTVTLCAPGRAKSLMIGSNASTRCLQTAASNISRIPQLASLQRVNASLRFLLTQARPLILIRLSLDDV